ncbi:hypothetical protein AAHA92_07217 [Salvia divinorum]|uniref:Pectinesterase inhibitor domain-containing protein n=1 Tax=Salvia divinorum TaxID=28513 RepID=A0ABD1IB62_SALDI
MPCSISSIVFTALILVLFPTPHAASSSPLIKDICAIIKNNYNIDMCDKTLESEPGVASARNMYDLTVEIMKSSISRSNNTRHHIEVLQKKNSTNPEANAALNQCHSSYDYAIGSTRSALAEVEEGEYQTASYDLLLAATDALLNCQEVVASKVITDRIIVRGNKLARLFGYSAFVAVDKIPPP